MNSLAFTPNPIRTMDFPESNMQARFRLLPPSVQKEVLRRSLQWGVSKGLQDYRTGMQGMGQDAMTSAIQVAIERAIKPILPVIQKQLMGAVEPAAQKAADLIGPAVRKELDSKLPLFAIITGLTAAILGIVGMSLVGGYVVKSVKKVG